MDAAREHMAADVAKDERLEAARAYVGTLERILHKNRHVLTESHTSALALGAGRFRAAFYPSGDKGSGVDATSAARLRHGDASGVPGTRTAETGSQTAATAPAANDGIVGPADRSSSERALRASLRLAEAARAALASELDEARRRCESLEQDEAARKELHGRLVGSEARCTELEGRVAQLEADAAAAKADAHRMQRALAAGSLSGQQRASCREISEAAVALEELLPRAVALIEAAGEASTAEASLAECGPLLDGLAAALGRIATGH